MDVVIKLNELPKTKQMLIRSVIDSTNPPFNVKNIKTIEIIKEYNKYNHWLEKYILIIDHEHAYGIEVKKIFEYYKVYEWDKIYEVKIHSAQEETTILDIIYNLEFLLFLVKTRNNFKI